MEKISVLIPSYNEAKTIGGIIKDLKAKNLSVCVIDDGSIDETAAIAAREGATVLKHDKNKGKGASLIDGFRHALKEGFSAVLVMDGDGQHKTSDVDNFFRKMDETGADIVIGNRMFNVSSMPITRRLTNIFMSFLISKMCGHDIPDTQCGFKLIKRRVLEGLKLESSNYEIESELLFKAARKGFKIESVPVETVYENEQSKINPVVDTVRFITLLIKTMAGR
ncbi:MAG: glycosyltransferase family 2 protein [Candidatus Omnitrophota bacterium]|nr:glycosyltransferase family 2 protein [Candidatus Omnitrophota bacterium]